MKIGPFLIGDVNMKQIIENGKTYRVRKYNSIKMVADYGTLLGEDVKPIIKGHEYWQPEWETTGMWYSKSGKIGIEVLEVK